MEVINFLLSLYFLSPFSPPSLSLILPFWKVLSNVNWKAFESCGIKDKVIHK